MDDNEIVRTNPDHSILKIDEKGRIDASIVNTGLGSIPAVSTGILSEVTSGQRILGRGAPLTDLGAEMYNDLQRDFFWSHFLSTPQYRPEMPEGREINAQMLQHVLSDPRTAMHRLMFSGRLIPSAAVAFTLFEEMMKDSTTRTAMENAAAAEKMEEQADDLDDQADQEEQYPQDQDGEDQEDQDDQDPGDQSDQDDDDQDSDEDGEQDQDQDGQGQGNGRGKGKSGGKGQSGDGDDEDQDEQDDDSPFDQPKQPRPSPKKMRENAQKLRQQAAEAREQAAQLVENIAGNPFANVMRSGATGKAAEVGEQVAAFMANWGLGDGDGAELSIDEILELMKFMSNPQLMALTNLMGRVYEIATSILRGRSPLLIQVEDGGFTKEIDDIVQDELAMLSPYAPAEIRNDTLDRFSRDGLAGVIKSSEAKNEGNFICGIDGSGSMMETLGGYSSGGPSKAVVAMALFLGLSRAAKVNGQGFNGMTFGGSQMEISNIVTERSTTRELFQHATHIYGGGTDFDVALNILMDIFENLDDIGKTQADILMITDGQAGIDNETAERFMELREQHGCRLFVLMIGGSSYQSIVQLADEILDFKDLDSMAETLAGLMWRK